MAAQTLPELVTRALVEDVGDGDVTTRAVVPARAMMSVPAKIRIFAPNNVPEPWRRFTCQAE